MLFAKDLAPGKGVGEDLFAQRFRPEIAVQPGEEHGDGAADGIPPHPIDIGKERPEQQVEQHPGNDTGKYRPGGGAAREDAHQKGGEDRAVEGGADLVDRFHHGVGNLVGIKRKDGNEDTPQQGNDFAGAEIVRRQNAKTADKIAHGCRRERIQDRIEARHGGGEQGREEDGAQAGGKKQHDVLGHQIVGMGLRHRRLQFRGELVSGAHCHAQQDVEHPQRKAGDAVDE